MPSHEYYLRIAETVSSISKDPNTKVGAVIVQNTSIISTGYNGMVAGASEIWTRPEKYLWVCHAEENAIAQAAKHGQRCAGAVLYCTHFPCLRCYKMAIQAGIRTLYFIENNHSEKYKSEQVMVYSLAHEVGGFITGVKNDVSNTGTI